MSRNSHWGKELTDLRLRTDLGITAYRLRFTLPVVCENNLAENCWPRYESRCEGQGAAMVLGSALG
jgi:hypothetical protein